MLKAIHITCVALSYSLFLLRGIWLMRHSPIMRQRWLKIAPHSIDTILLTSAILLAWQLGYTPFNSPWLAAKILALLLYIGLGMLAFRFAKTDSMRLVAWLSAQLAFFYIVAAAVTHDPFPSL
ncbi:MAG: SirB2 family protein [Gallionella sp.]|nr:SirB2 family protein [Gallionella sp.]